MKIAFTGHRPHLLGGYNDKTNRKTEILYKIHDIIKDMSDREIITGMALGVDQWVAEYAIWHTIPFHAYLPFSFQEAKWPGFVKKKYNKILEKASSVKIILPDAKTYAPWRMQARNKAMVDDCDLLVAVWNGKPSGTGNCVEYARKKGREIIIIDV